MDRKAIVDLSTVGISNYLYKITISIRIIAWKDVLNLMNNIDYKPWDHNADDYIVYIILDNHGIIMD